MITIHAPSANFVTMTIAVTSAVTAAPTPLRVAFAPPAVPVRGTSA